MNRPLLVSLAFYVLVAACDTTDSATANTEDALSCGERSTDIVQILIGNLQSGQTIRDSYRLSEDGNLSRASWTDDNIVLGLSEIVNIGSESYLDAIEILSSLEPSKDAILEEGVLPSPTALTIELVFAKAQKRVEYIFRVDEPDALNRLILDWQQQAQLEQPIEGGYVWTLPAPILSSDADLSIAQPACDDEVNKTVNEGALGANVIVKAPNAVNEFVNNGRTGRARYIARSSHGFVYFGVLSTL